MEKRNFSRVSFRMTAWISGPEGDFEGEVDNLSLKGMWLSTEVSLELGTTVQVRMTLSEIEEAATLKLIGKIVRTTPAGAGIHFEEMDLDTFNYLSKIIEYNMTDSRKAQDELVRFISKNLT